MKSQWVYPDMVLFRPSSTSLVRRRRRRKTRIKLAPNFWADVKLHLDFDRSDEALSLVLLQLRYFD